MHHVDTSGRIRKMVRCIAIGGTHTDVSSVRRKPSLLIDQLAEVEDGPAMLFLRLDHADSDCTNQNTRIEFSRPHFRRRHGGPPSTRTLLNAIEVLGGHPAPHFLCAEFAVPAWAGLGRAYGKGSRASEPRR